MCLFWELNLHKIHLNSLGFKFFFLNNYDTKNRRVPLNTWYPPLPPPRPLRTTCPFFHFPCFLLCLFLLKTESSNDSSGSYWTKSSLKKGNLILHPWNLTFSAWLQWLVKCFNNKCFVEWVALILCSQWYYLSEIGNVTKQSDHVFRIVVVKKILQIWFRDTTVLQILNLKMVLAERKDILSPSFSKRCLFNSDILLATSKIFSHLLFSSDSNWHCEGETGTADKCPTMLCLACLNNLMVWTL